MSDWPPDFTDPELEVDEEDMGEPVTDKLLVLLEDLPEDAAEDEEGDVDLGEPVTDTLQTLLGELPEDWDSDDSGTEFEEMVTDRLGSLLDELAETSRPVSDTQRAYPREAEASTQAESGGLVSRLRRWLARLFGRDAS